MRTHAPATPHGNNFGVLRLLFALLVIVSHSPELVDGNRSRELLTRAFGTMSFGAVAVSGFFLISGYLIAQSRDRTPSLVSFGVKRAARILPGYAVAFAICLVLLAPLVGATPCAPSELARRAFSQVSRLLPPEAPGAFASLPYPTLNGSMWTIAYEARCYAAVAVLGLLPRRSRGSVLLLAGTVVAALLVTASGMADAWSLPPALERTLGRIGPTIGFAGAFGAGVLFYLGRHRVPWSGPVALGAMGLLAAGLSRPGFAEPAFVVCGGYLIFYAAFRPPVPWLSGFADEVDLSYGIYLYAWPIGSATILADPRINPWLLCLLTMATSAVFGAASWFLVERPALRQAGKVLEALERRRALLGQARLPLPAEVRTAIEG